MGFVLMLLVLVLVLMLVRVGIWIGVRGMVCGGRRWRRCAGAGWAWGLWLWLRLGGCQGAAEEVVGRGGAGRGRDGCRVVARRCAVASAAAGEQGAACGGCGEASSLDAAGSAAWWDGRIERLRPDDDMVDGAEDGERRWRWCPAP